MRGTKALVIEDTLSLSSAITSELESSYDIACDIAASLEEAKALLEQSSGDYFIASVDLQLPDCQTGEAVDLVNKYKIPAIIFTGQQEPSIRERFKTHDLVDYVFKTGAHSINYICWLIQRVQLNHAITVLVVDDSQAVTASLKKLLGNQGFKVISAEDAAHCRIAMKQEPDIVVLDQYLPDGLGHELCQEIRTKHHKPTLQIIGVTSKIDEDTAAFFLKNGADDFLASPFNPEEFTNRINHRASYIDQIRELHRVSEEKNHFLGMAAHDLRNPLGVIQQASKRLFDGSLSEERLKSLKDMMQKSIYSMQLLLDDLLDISAMEKGKLELRVFTLNLSELIKERVVLFEPKAQAKDIEIVSSLPDSIMIELDPTRITQVIDNLLSNAIKYSPKKSKVAVKATKEKAFIRVSVIDEGAGIETKDVPQLFKAFQRLGHKTTGGESSHGLGLSICLKIIKAHKGNIGYEDASGKGSHFYFELPRQC